MAFVITADSVPVPDGWGWGDYWSCAEYVQWHKLNVQAYGSDVANQKFVSAWSSISGILSTDHNYNWCKYDRSFADYFAAYGIDVGNILSNAVTAAGNIVNAAGNVTQGVSNTTQLLKWALPVALVIALIIASMWAYNKFARV